MIWLGADTGVIHGAALTSGKLLTPEARLLTPEGDVLNIET